MRRHSFCAKNFLAVSLLAAASLFATPAAAVYVQTNLVSNIPGLAPLTDPDLVNPWGLSRSATSPWWSADNGTGVATLYNVVTGTKQTPTGNTLGHVEIPNPAGGLANPTGTVFNGNAAAFLLPTGAAARFIFATEQGTIAGWASGNTATTLVNKAGQASYKGLAIANNRLYAANFQTGTVDAFDAAFTPILSGAFTDSALQALGYAPFGIQTIGSNIYVSYALRDAATGDEVAGAGLGYVDVYDTNGVFIRRVASNGTLNAPWGIALAPSNFGELSNDLLIGNFGDGTINAFNATTDAFIGQLMTDKGLFAVDGLWAIAFGGGGTASSGPSNALFFTAGINDEEDGLFGELTVPEPSSFIMLSMGLLGLMGLTRVMRTKTATLI